MFCGKMGTTLREKPKKVLAFGAVGGGVLSNMPGGKWGEMGPIVRVV